MAYGILQQRFHGQCPSLRLPTSWVRPTTHFHPIYPDRSGHTFHRTKQLFLRGEKAANRICSIGDLTSGVGPSTGQRDSFNLRRLVESYCDTWLPLRVWVDDQ